MEKPAVTDHEILPLLARRWSPRSFASTPVEPEKLCSLFEAARWAASCFNDQPWSLIVATQADTVSYQKIIDCLVPANQIWAPAAPVLMLVLAQKTFKHNGSPNQWGEYDTGQAMGTLLVQATSMDLFIHQMGGFDADKAIAAFKLPEHVKPIAAAALGYAGEISSLPPNLQEKEIAPRSRHPLSSFVFTDEWGKAAPFV